MMAYLVLCPQSSSSVLEPDIRGTKGTRGSRGRVAKRHTCALEPSMSMHWASTSTVVPVDVDGMGVHKPVRVGGFKEAKPSHKR